MQGEQTSTEILTPTITSDKRAADKKDRVIELSKSSSTNVFECTVAKRNGMLVPFRRDRVSNAVEAAFRATNNIPVTEPLTTDVYRAVQQITQLVVDDCMRLAKVGGALTVEGIQDVVEAKIMEAGFHEVAKNYIIYRDQHKKLREDSPQNLKILRRDGETRVRFNPMKIAAAIEKAFRASLKIEGQTPVDEINSVNFLTGKVVNEVMARARAGTEIDVEMVQDVVERELMAEGFYQVAKDFIIYRSKRAEIRDRIDAENEARSKDEARVDDSPGREFNIIARNGQPAKVTEGELRKRIAYACRDLGDLVSVEEILQNSIANFYEGMKQSEVETSNIFAAKAKIEVDPAYSTVAARLLLDVLYEETLGVHADHPKLEEIHREYFKAYVRKGIELDRISPDLLNFDLDKLARSMNLKRDAEFTYLGLQTLYDRYFIHQEEIRLETPQIFFMRVAMGLSLNEGAQKHERAAEFYDLISSSRYMCSTPTLFNAGTAHPQLSSCYLSTVMDDLQHIFKVVSDDAQLSKWAGGLGNDWTNVRATGSRIKGTNGLSQGVIPFLKVANDTAVAVNQGGKRKGAMCAYLETWHLDIEDFLELRKNTGDERRRTHDMNTANWIPDLFMKRVITNGTWTLFSPSDVPDLHDLYGAAFEKRYMEYEEKVKSGELKLFKQIDALTLWRKMLSMLFETGHPWITFKDPSNVRSPQSHVGVVHSSNLCTEILLNTSREETAVCNLGSVNLLAHTTKDGLNLELLGKTVRTAVRMLDNVIDINFYPTPEARNANLRHRPVGLGIMGFQDALYVQNIPYASLAAVEFADKSMEAISYFAILASSELAAERGTYPTYQGSLWSKGVLPMDSIEILAKERGGYLDMNRDASLDWKVVREAVKRNGVRNSNTMAIAPTATISNITGVTQSIEPMYKHLFVKSNLSGEFTVPNVHLVEKLKERGLWDEEMLDDLKYFDGSIMEIDRIPDDLKQIFLTAFEIEPEWIIECGSRRQKWIDMGQSLNLYLAQPSGKKLHDMYILAWQRGLKTTYYLRSLGATQIEKSTTDINKRGLQPRWMKNKSESASVVVQRDEGSTDVAAAPAPKVCNMEEGCESCQ